MRSVFIGSDIGFLIGTRVVVHVIRHTSVHALVDSLANVLINVAALGLYSLAGLVLLPAVFATPGYSRWLAWLDAAEWGPFVPHSGIRCAGCCAVNQ